MITRRFVVRGRVQGVGFRWFVRESARALGLAGHARNRTDGTVEVVARGPDAAIADLHQRLAAGPDLAEVDTVEVQELADDVSLTRFEIRQG